MNKKIIFLKSFSKLIAVLIFAIAIFSCKSTKEKKIEPKKKSPDTISYVTLSFSGDIMAHDVNYKMQNYDRIYDSVRDLLTADDLSFGNIEMPICDALPLSSFPRFNVHKNYLKAAIDGGFDVFSFANNHTNDQKIKGIHGTLNNIKLFQRDADLYYSGIKEAETEDIRPILIEKNGWKILFLSITEILNSHDSSKQRVYYSEPNSKGRKILLEKIKKMKEENPCDVFVLSLHLAEAEYGLRVLESKKKWFRALAVSGVDIVWAHHPHVLQPWEVVELYAHKDINTAIHRSEDPYIDTNANDQLSKKVFFMYSMGNFISGQRWKRNYKDPNHYREYTGDSAIMQVKLKKINGKIANQIEVKPVLITNYDLHIRPIVKLFTQDFIETLNEKEKKYFTKRFELMHNYLPLKRK